MMKKTAILVLVFNVVIVALALVLVLHIIYSEHKPTPSASTNSAIDVRGSQGKEDCGVNCYYDKMMRKCKCFNSFVYDYDDNKLKEETTPKYPEIDITTSTVPPTPSSEPSSLIVCPNGTVRYKDYQDTNGIYNSGTCTLIKDPSLISHRCHDSSSELSYGKCEGKMLDEQIFEEFEKIVEYSNVERGGACHYSREKEIRNWIRTGKSKLNKYDILQKLEMWRLLGKKGLEGLGDGFCDRTKLLECSKNKICECLEGMEPRKVIVDGIEHYSDYCFLTEGKCVFDEKMLITLTASEKKIVTAHYGGDFCRNISTIEHDDGEKFTANDTEETAYNGTPHLFNNERLVVLVIVIALLKVNI